MSIRIAENVAWLEGVCGLADAQSLHAALSAGEAKSVEISACEHMHGAIAQILLAFGTPVAGEPEDGFLREHLAPALEASRMRIGDKGEM